MLKYDLYIWNLTKFNTINENLEGKNITFSFLKSFDACQLRNLWGGKLYKLILGFTKVNV